MVQKLLFLFFLISTSLYLNAQEWQNSFGLADRHNYSAASTPTPDGGYLILCNNSQPSTPNTHSQEYISLYKLDEVGQVLWEKHYDQVGWRGNKIYASAFGGYWVTGFERFELAGSEISLNRQLIIRIDEQGNIIWQNTYTYTDPNEPDITFHSINRDFEELSNGDVILLSEVFTSWGNYGKITKIDSDGHVLNSFLITVNASNILAAWPNLLTLTSDGHYLLGGVAMIEINEGAFDQQAFLLKMTEDGNVLWFTPFGDIGFDSQEEVPLEIQEDADGNYLIAMNAYNYDGPFKLGKADSNGHPLWTKAYEQLPFIAARAAIVTPNNDFVYIGYGLPTDPYDPNTSQIYAVRVASNGDLKWYKKITNSDQSVYFNLANSPDGELLIMGYQPTDEDQINLAKVLKPQGIGTAYSNAISGLIAQDENQDCIVDTLEQTYANWLVKAESSQAIYFGISDTMGRYNINLDTGTYNVEVIPIGPYWQSCIVDTTLSFSSFGDSTVINFPQQDTISCPLLTVDISTPFLRRCFDNTYYVKYSNIGNLIAENAFIEITFDPFIIVNSSTLPWSIVEENTYTFLVGSLAIGQEETFTINTTVNCEETVLGQTHCVHAHIRPDTLCAPILPVWDGASLELSSICEQDSIRFIIKNVGDGMSTPVPYLIVEDNVMLYQGQIELASQEEEIFALEATGATYFIRVAQPEGHPGNDQPSSVVEGCGGTTYNVGFASQFPENDGNPFISIDCQENIGAFDPNDKIGYPIGWTEDHLVEVNQEIEYRIRFQNTGTDTAFNIVVLDTLSEHLDLSTFRPGVASHPYKIDILAGHVLKYSFENVMLPDSNINEAASHGFFKFKINQKRDNSLGTQVLNSAAIYFDFNEPVITNQTYHTVGERLLVSVEPDPISPGINQVQVYPNPFAESAQFVLDQNTKLPIEFKLFDISGKQMRQEIHQSTHFTLARNGLPVGIYFYQLLAQGKMVSSGKIIVQ